MPFPRRRSSSADWLAVETTWRIRGTRRRDNLTLHQIQAAFTARGPRTIHQRRKVSSANRMIDARTSKYAQRGVDAQSRGCRKRVIGVWAPPSEYGAIPTAGSDSRACLAPRTEAAPSAAARNGGTVDSVQGNWIGRSSSGSVRSSLSE